MTTFLALYRGPTVAEARLVAVTADPALVAELAGRLLEQQRPPEAPDPVLATLERGRRAALRLIRQEAVPEHGKL